MIVEAQKVENGLFIPMIRQFKKIKQGKIPVEDTEGFKFCTGFQ